MNHLASSIHTIYRPLARSRRGKQRALSPLPRASKLGPVAEGDGTPRSEEVVVSDDELQDDFESPDDTQEASFEGSQPELPSASSESNGEERGRQQPSRTGSMGTVKLQRRSRLAEKLRDVFELQGIHEVVAGTHIPLCHTLLLNPYVVEMPCWLLRSIRLYPNPIWVTLDPILMS